MKVFKILIILSIGAPAVFAAGPVREGKSGSGGGNAVICFDSREAAAKVKKQGHLVLDEDLSHIRKIEVIDLYELTEGRFSKTRKLFLSQANSDRDFLKGLEEYFDKKLINSWSWEPEKFYSYSSKLNKIFSPDSIMRISKPLKRMVDSNEVVDIDADPYCDLVTVVVQVATENLTELTIDDRLFNHPKHSSISRGVFWLHELMYHPFLKNGAPDSLFAQRRVQAMISFRIGMTFGEWAQELYNKKIIGFSPQMLKPRMFKDIGFLTPEEMNAVLTGANAVMNSVGERLLKTPVDLHKDAGARQAAYDELTRARPVALAKMASLLPKNPNSELILATYKEQLTWPVEYLLKDYTYTAGMIPRYLVFYQNVPDDPTQKCAAWVGEKCPLVNKSGEYAIANPSYFVDALYRNIPL